MVCQFGQSGVHSTSICPNWHTMGVLCTLYLLECIFTVCIAIASCMHNVHDCDHCAFETDQQKSKFKVLAVHQILSEGLLIISNR